MKALTMRFITILFLFLIFSSVSGWCQSRPVDATEVIKPSKYMLKAISPSGVVISTTGRIMRAIALSRPQSLEIARIYLNYIATVKLNTDVSGETSAVVSFQAMKLSGDVVYKGFDIENQIFPSLVTFRLILPGSAPGSVTAKQVLATVSAVSVNSGNCSVSISLHKKVTTIPIIDKLAFYHSEDDYEKAEAQMKLIDRYNVAGWVMKRTENLLDVMQLSQLHDPAAFLASNLEVIVLNDWMIRQHFNLYPIFQKNDTLSLAKRLVINSYRKKLVDQDFIKSNVIREDDLLKATNIFVENLANYFDTSQPDLIKATYLSQMAGSRLSSIGYKAIRDFADSYAAVHKHCKVDWRLFVTASSMIRHAMTVHASQLADDEQFSEAMGLLNASDNYNLQKGNSRSSADSILIGKLSKRLYGAYLDIAIKSLNIGIYRVSNDCYQKAILLKQTYSGMITPDSRERYVADLICKAMLISAGNSFKSNDIESALEVYEQIVRLAESARLKNAYETARIRLEAISNRPSGYKPWKGIELAVIVPAKESVKAKDKALTVPSKNRLKEKDSAVAVSIKTKDSILLEANSRNFQAIKIKLSDSNKKPILVSLKTKAIAKTFNIPEIKQQISENIKGIHLEIWSGDTISSAILLNKTDSLQQLLTQTGVKGFESELKALRINYDEMRCTQQNKAYSQELVQIRNLLKLNDFSSVNKQLQKLIAKTFNASCKVDKSEAIILLSTLESPLVYEKLCVQLDSITKTQEPESIIEAFEQASTYYHDNALDKLGMPPPDLMSAFKSRIETPFLLKAISQMLNTHRPVYALELLKEIYKLEPEPDITYSMQKRLGEMLASGDHSTEISVSDKLNSYNIEDKWYDEMTSAYKKQWKKFSN